MHAIVLPLKERMDNERIAAAFIVGLLPLTVKNSLPAEDDAGYLRAVESAFMSSDIYEQARIAAAISKARTGAIDPTSAEGERIRRSLTAEHAFYGPRYNLIMSLMTFFRGVQTPAQVRQLRDTMIAEFNHTVQGQHSLQPANVATLLLLLRSVTDDGQVRPQSVGGSYRSPSLPSPSARPTGLTSCPSISSRAS